MAPTEPLRPPHGRGAALAGFSSAVLLGLLPLGLPASPWLLAATLPALAAALFGAAFALQHRPEQRVGPTLRRRMPAVLWLLLLGSAGMLGLAGWPAHALLTDGALWAVLLLSAALALTGVGLARVWPAPGLPLIDAPRCGGSVALARRSLQQAGELVAADPSASRSVLGSLAWLLLLGGALLVGLAGGLLEPALRLALTIGWAVLLPFLAFVLLALIEPARLASAQTPIPELPKPPAREPVPESSGMPTAAAVPMPPTAALYRAARSGRIDVALAQLEAGADPHALPAAGERDQRSLPMLAALLGDTRLLRALIERGVDVNRRHAGLTPLLAATRDSLRGRTDAVTTLLANGADPRATDADGRTALHFAALTGEPDIAALLLDAGAPLEALNRDGFSPLGVACGAGNWRLARFLLERKARPDPAGGQPVLLAAAAGDDDPAGVQLLLKHKAKVDARGRLGRTALMNACLAGNLQIVDALLAAGAEAGAADEHGVTPLHEAARAGANPVLRRLVAARPDPRAVDGNGRSALLVACQSSSADAETVALLLELGADPTQPALDGRSALDCAIAAGRWPLVAVLDPDRPLPASLFDHLPGAELTISPDDAAHWPERLADALADADLGRLDALLRVPPADGPERLLAAFEQLPDARPAALRQRLAAAIAAQADPHAIAALQQRLLARPALGALQALLERGLPIAGSGTLARLLHASTRSGGDSAAAERFALTLLEQGADPFGAEQGERPLLLAVRLGWSRLLAALLARGVDPETTDRRGRSALHLACMQREPALIRPLLAAGAQPDRRDASGTTPLGLALAASDHALAEWLDWSGPWPLPRRPLRDADLVAAAAVGDVAAVERLLALGLPLDARDGQGATALLRACGNGQQAVVDRLLTAGADPLLPALSGATCLSAAVSTRQTAIVERLIAAGVPVDQPLPGGITPLMVAAGLGWPEPMQRLIGAGADVGHVDDQGQAATHMLAQWGATAQDRSRASLLWQVLLGAGADPDLRSAAGLSPLALLLGARCEPGSLRDEDTLAAQLELLLARQLDLDVRDGRGFTPLHLAALHGQVRAVRRLLVAGADREARDQLNRRPQDIAVMRGFVDIAAELETRSEPTPSLARFLREPR